MIVIHRRNEELDDKVVIRRLKKRVAELEAEISSLKGSPTVALSPSSSGAERGSSSFSRPLSDTDRQQCHQILHGFFHGKIDNPVMAGEGYYIYYRNVAMGIFLKSQLITKIV